MTTQWLEVELKMIDEQLWAPSECGRLDAPPEAFESDSSTDS